MSDHDTPTADARFSRGLSCEAVRTALSARLDGEEDNPRATTPTSPQADAVDAHIAACDACQRWYSTVSAMNRSFRLSVLSAEPAATPRVSSADLADAVIASATASGWKGRQLPLLTARVLLVCLAVAFWVWSAVTLLTPVPAELAGGAEPTTANPGAWGPALSPDLASLAIARFGLGVGLAAAAWRPRLASGMLPIYAALCAFGGGLAAHSIVMSLVDAAYRPAMLGHVGALLMHLVAVAALVTCWLGRHHMVTPLRQSLALARAQPMSASVSDVRRNSRFRPGDPSHAWPAGLGDEDGEGEGELGGELGGEDVRP